MPGGWVGSDRRERLPDNWSELKAEGDRRNPQRICHVCGLPGGEDFDHKNGKWWDNRQDNLDWIHGRRSVERGVSEVNCHGKKTSAEGNAARRRVSNRRPKPPHPGLL
ncbi:hypothetical protein ABZY58_11650 [Micromonospora tulbaghiae]|uniref:hypothetical protein n=1 Tax=Micromonospora tulbaghiae TaxID=479978 RepID=UPI0033AB6D6C